ncbi:MAG: tetratricopeptide repeat protein [Deltaproteobacteria bacterium]|nr:tetratricopeptide repeat protein [Deltaproteobacteria bacterium]
MRALKVLTLTIMATALLFFVSGCTPSVTLKMPVPAKYNYGSAKQLVVVEMTGKRSYRETVLDQFNEQARSSSWWQFEDRIDNGIKIRLKGSSATANPESPQEGEIFVKVDMYGLDAVKGSEQIKKKDTKGNYYYETRRFLQGQVSFGVTVMDVNGRALLAEREYEATSKVYTNYGYDKDDAKEKAAENAVKKVLFDITPRFVNSYVTLDDEAEDLKPTIDLIKNGAYAVAADDLKRMMADQPMRSDIVYNLAVVTEAMGEFDQALDYYSKAMSLGSKPFYATSRANCAKRIEAQKALGS